MMWWCLLLFQVAVVVVVVDSTPPSNAPVTVGLPPPLIPALLSYCHRMGIVDQMETDDTFSEEEWFVSLGNRPWHIRQRASNVPRMISPADEFGHEDCLNVLMGDGGFGSVLDTIGTMLNMDGLVAYQFTFMGGSFGEEGFVQEDDAWLTNGSAYTLMIPLMLLQEREEIDTEYSIGQGVLLNGARDYDYRNISTAIGMKLAAIVYIADVNEENVADITTETFTQIFPLPSEEWLMSQAGRHWRRGDNAMMNGDRGRKAFRFRDDLDDCHDRIKRGFCESDEIGTRRKCQKTCNVYIEEGPISIAKLDEKHVQVCTQNRTGSHNCKSFLDIDDIDGHFVTPNLQPGELFPMIWRDTNEIATPYAFQIGFPPQLITTLQHYCDRLGVTVLFRDLLGPNPISPKDDTTGRFVELADGNKWYAQRPAKKWTSNMHWVSPADEQTHEEYLKVLAEGNFDLVLDAVGRYLGLKGLVAYHLTFIGVSHSEKGYIHHDSTNTGASVYNVIIPLILEDDSSPELVMIDGIDETKTGALKYKIGMGALMGDDAMHGTEACDYRSTKGMRIAATVYIADVNYNNAWDITSQTLTQIFPLQDTRWLLTQAGRHWGDSNDNSLVNDQGRKQFIFHDSLMDCSDRVEDGLCESGTTTQFTKAIREKCMKSCQIYDESLNVKSDSTNNESNVLEQFFDAIGDDPSCIDESEECAEMASKGLCMTDVSLMKDYGCRFSCFYCLSSDSNIILHMGEEQIFTEEGRDTEELPSYEDILAVMTEAEGYFINEVFVFDEYEHVRLACRNNFRECSLWAAEGECDEEGESYGWMRKECAAACRDCLGVDPETRCPVDYDSNIFGPGDINSMFHRWLEEAGEDVSTFSRTNLPKGGKHPYGEITVVTSPYQDMIPLLTEEEKRFAHEYTPVPWVIAIEDFLSDEECQRLIELGGNDYERSMEYSSQMSIDGSFAYVESQGRTSTNTWCKDKCRDDPIAKAVIERITNMTQIPYNYYEDLQLVRYEPGQFYRKHHDFADGHVDAQYGPRLITFFLYLNDVEEGGGTQFEDLKFAAQPKRGRALIWPSVTNDNIEEKDDWTWHEALPVIKGVKYGANAWIHLRDYQNVPDHCS